MKKFKISLLIILIMTISIAAVSAADNSSELEIAQVEDSMLDVSSDVENNVVQSTNDFEILSDEENGNNFTSLQSTIDNGGLVSLSSDYVRVDGEYDVLISKNVTLFGNNHKIDADNKGGIFKVQSGCTLTLIGVTLINGNAEYGGAIYNNGNLAISHSYLINNTATKSGGAIYDEGGNVNVFGSTFDNNIVRDLTKNDDTGGAAIHAINSNITITDSRITNNGNKSMSRTNNDLTNGAINLLSSEAHITNTLFENNTGIYGSAITALPVSGSTSKNIKIDACNFTNNVAYAGTVHIEKSSYTILNSIFTKNMATGVGSNGYTAAGGAISILYNADECLIDNCTFIKNSVTNTSNAQGGAISIEFNEVTIINSRFEENSAEIVGGAIDAYETTIIIKNCDFTGNSANTGGAISASGNTSISNSAFVDNEAANYTNAMYIWKTGSSLNLSNNTITAGEYAQIRVQNGVNVVSPLKVVILENSTKNITMAGCNITAVVTDDMDNLIIDLSFRFVVGDNEVSGIIINSTTGVYATTFIPNDDGTFVVSTNLENTSKIQTATLNIYRTLSDLVRLINDAEEDSTIVLDDDYAYNDEFDSDLKMGIVINKNIVIDGKGFVISGSDVARIFNITNANLTLLNVTIRDAKADKGAGVYVNKNSTLMAKNVNFINNTATYRGGAIYSEGKVSVVSSVFDSNDITFRVSNNDNGGAAIYNLNGTLTVTNVNVTNNLKDIVIRNGNAGDLLVGVVVTSGETLIEGSYFANNAGSWGGAISSLGYLNSENYTLTIKDTKFEGNNATFGGSVFVESSKLVVDNCTFENNRGVGIGSPGTSNTQGGAIVTFGDVASARIVDSTFVDNSADVGGAVSLAGVGVDSIIDNCTFTDNVAHSGGGAVYLRTNNDASVTIEDSKFNGNEASFGGAILSGNAKLFVTNSKFIENTAVEGGAINAAGITSVSNSNFTDNVAQSFTNAILYRSGEITLSENNITGNNGHAQIHVAEGSKIISKVKAVILDNKTINWAIVPCNVPLIITDDVGNKIVDLSFKFTLNGDETDLITYGINSSTGEYEAVFTPNQAGIFVVGLNYENESEIQTGKIIISRSLTDLKTMIDNSNENTIVLDGGYTYIEEFDSEIVNGIVVNKNIVIDGKGFVISGSDVARIFNITNANLTLLNVTICDAKADKGAGVYVNKNSTLMAKNVNFINNTATYRGGAIYSEGKVSVVSSVFDSNDITFRVSNNDNGGAAIYNLNGTLTVTNVNVTNNLKDIVIRNGNAGDLLVGVVVTSGETLIEGSYFANNAGSWGGAISSLGYLNSENYTLTIKDTKFEGNNATFGGSVFVESSKLVVDNCTFENNRGVGIGSPGTSYTQGGAIVVFGDVASANIVDSTFVDNSADVGGAVSLAGVGVDSIIDNCTFTDNVAHSGGAAVYIRTNNDASVTIEDSKFNGNVNPRGATILNDGVLKLRNNTINKINAEIYNYKIINSYINITFLGNQTLSAKLDDIVILNATFVDDNGNRVYDSYLKFSVNGETISDIKFNETTGVYTCEYKIVSAGENIISSIYNYGNVEKFIGIYNVPKENVTSFIVVTGQDNKFAYGENVTVFVSLYGVNGAGLNDNVIVIVNNTPITVNVVDGKASFNVSGFEPGQYAILGIFEGNNNYNGFKYASTTFDVLLPDKILSIEVEDIKYGEVAIVNITVTDANGEKEQGIVILNISGTDYVVRVDGKASLEIKDLPIGTYLINATLLHGSLEAEIINDTESFKVSIQDEYDMNAIGIETHCGQAVEIDVVLPEDVVDGIVSVTINGIDYTANVNNGKAVIHGPADLPIGNYSNLVVTYSGGSKYADSSVKVNLTVVGANSQLKSSAAYYVIDYEQMLIISVNADNLVSGEIDAYNNGEYYSSFDVQDALENGISISSLTVGTHNITLAYKGNQYFAPANVSVLCVVEKITPVIKSNVTQDASVGDIITINATISGHTEGNVTITVDGELVYNGKTNHGIVSVDVDSIVAGKHTYIVSFLGDDNYLACDNVGTFNVVKVVPVISIGEISGNVGDTVNVVVTVAGGDASGYVLIDGVSAVVENGQATIPINILNAGENTISVVYTGDDKYNGGTQTATYAAGKYASKVTIVPIVNVTYGNVVEIAYVIDNETESVTVSVNDAAGGTYEAVVNKGVITVSNLPVGTYTITIKNGENNKYSGSEADANFIVSKSEVNIVVSSNTPAFGEDAIVSVTLPEDVTGNVTVTINGISYKNTVERGSATVTIPANALTAGENNITVTYSGDKNYASKEVKSSINVKKAVPKFTSDVSENNIYGGDVTITVTASSDATGAVSLLVDGKIISTGKDLDNGKVVFAVGGLAAGYHSYNVTYEGDNNYESSSNSGAFEVTKVSTVIISQNFAQYSCEASTGEKGGYYTIRLTDVNGNPLANKSVGIGYNGILAWYTTDENGTVNKLIGLQNAGPYTFATAFLGDENYTASYAVNKITINMKPTYIKASAKTYKASAKTKTFKVKLTTVNNINGKMYLNSGKKITLNVNGKTYTAKTNSKGIATFKLKLTKKGKYTAMISYEGQYLLYEKSTKSVKITIK